MRATRFRDPGVVERWPVRQSVGAGVLGAAAGATIEYLLDIDRGRARRARVRDKAVRTAYKLNDGLGVVARDAGNRGRGVLYGIRYQVRGRTVDDVVLHERVRATLGQYVSHPHAVHVEIRDGVATLTGDVLRADAAHARRAVRRVPGVMRVEERWRVHDEADVPNLQGESRRRQPQPELLQQHWSPAARMIVAGGALATWAAARRAPRPLAWTLRAVGALAAARAATNLPVSRLVGIRASGRAVDVQAAISVAAPPQQVWELVSDYANFPRFMTNVLEVRHEPDSPMSYWAIAGPAEAPIRFQAHETRREAGRALAWKTAVGQPIAHTGAIRLDAEPGDRTRVQVQLTYNPVFGAAGHAVATLFGANPRQKLREDLMRLKSYVETGTAPSDAARPDQHQGT
ncbi:MAG: SRPBCC family protein [Micromonosporaceae bacterium]